MGFASLARAPRPGRAESELTPSGDLPSSVHGVLRSPGHPLEPMVRTQLEARFGHDFSQVRVHTDRQAAESAAEVAAKAYTVGNHLVFRSGQYAPQTMAGRRAIAHELAHVVQQSRGGGAAPGFDAGSSLERAADHAADQASTGPGQPIAVAGASGPGLARQEDDDLSRLAAAYAVELKLPGTPGHTKAAPILDLNVARAVAATGIYDPAAQEKAPTEPADQQRRRDRTRGDADAGNGSTAVWTQLAEHGVAPPAYAKLDHATRQTLTGVSKTQRRLLPVESSSEQAGPAGSVVFRLYTELKKRGISPAQIEKYKYLLVNPEFTGFTHVEHLDVLNDFVSLGNRRRENYIPPPAEVARSIRKALELTPGRYISQTALDELSYRIGNERSALRKESGLSDPEIDRISFFLAATGRMPVTIDRDPIVAAQGFMGRQSEYDRLVRSQAAAALGSPIAGAFAGLASIATDDEATIQLAAAIGAMIETFAPVATGLRQLGPRSGGPGNIPRPGPRPPIPRPAAPAAAALPRTTMTPPQPIPDSILLQQRSGPANDNAQTRSRPPAQVIDLPQALPLAGGHDIRRPAPSATQRSEQVMNMAARRGGIGGRPPAPEVGPAGPAQLQKSEVVTRIADTSRGDEGKGWRPSGAKTISRLTNFQVARGEGGYFIITSDQGTIRALLDKERSVLYVGFAEASPKRQGFGTELARAAIKEAGDVRSISASMELDNYAAIVKAGGEIGATPAARILDRLGYTQHSYDPRTGRLTSTKPPPTSEGGGRGGGGAAPRPASGDWVRAQPPPPRGGGTGPELGAGMAPASQGASETAALSATSPVAASGPSFPPPLAPGAATLAAGGKPPARPASGTGGPVKVPAATILGEHDPYPRVVEILHTCPPKDRANLFADWVARQKGVGWTARQERSPHGTIWTAQDGRALVFDVFGMMFRGDINNPKQFKLRPDGSYEIDYYPLTLLKPKNQAGPKRR